MAADTLPSDKIALGRAVLLATDALGMRAEGAFWLYDSREDKWRYFLITSLFNSLGSREIYRRLNSALKKQLSERETRKFQLYMGGPTENLVAAIRASVVTDIYASEPLKIPAVALDHEKTRAIVYRLSDPADDREARRAKTRFRKLSNELMAA
jgi:hypothetical protein